MAIDCRSCLSIARSRRSLRRRAFPTPPAACSTSTMMSTTGVPARGNAKTKASHELKRLVVVVCVGCGCVWGGRGEEGGEGQIFAPTSFVELRWSLRVFIIENVFTTHIWSSLDILCTPSRRLKRSSRGTSLEALFFHFSSSLFYLSFFFIFFVSCFFCLRFLFIVFFHIFVG